MPSWILKTALQRIFSLLPASETWNEFFQRYVTRGLQLQPHGEFTEKLIACKKHFEHYQSFSRRPREEFTVFEIGPGWFPIIPIGLYLCGASEIWAFDTVPRLRQYGLLQVLECYRLFERDGALQKLLPGARRDRVAHLLELSEQATRLAPAEFLTLLNIHWRVRDVTRTELPSGSVDLVFSTGVLEHIDPPLLQRILDVFHRLMHDDSVMSHYIGIADQFASFDRSITPYNYLRFSDAAWRFYNSPLIPLNRLRVSDYRLLYQQAGFQVAHEENLKGDAEDLARIKLAPRFAKYSQEDLLVIFSWMVGRRVSGGLEAGPSAQRRGTRGTI